MLRFVLCSTIAVFVVLTDSEAARADVIVVGAEDTSSQTVIKTKPPAVLIVKPQTVARPTVVQAPPAPKRDRKLGLHFDVGGTFGPDVLLGGFSGALRFRPKEYLGIDLGSGYVVGNDYQGFYRTEIPLTADLLFFVNPQHKLQVYFLLGPGVSFGRVDMFDEVRHMTYVGGQVGLGLELRLAPAFALNVDVRGVLRHRVDDDPRPEFTDGERTTDTSAGGVLTFGATFYF
ncbi:MAG: outer membrane beta-barrel protein [Polyangiales bacterium]